jgi:hypothetical protein
VSCSSRDADVEEGDWSDLQEEIKYLYCTIPLRCSYIAGE